MDPLTIPPPEEVPLRDAPLARVIAQVRFPPILAIAQQDFVAPFQEAIRTTYAVLRQEQIQSVMVSAAAVGAAKPQVVWRFNDLAGHWRVSLAPEFLALETKRYISRADFLRRLQAVVAALDKHCEPRQIDRLGLRYINRIQGSALAEIADLVRAEVRGINGTAAATHATLAISESVFELEDTRMIARWGQIPAGLTIDPAVLEPIGEPSWVLDFDMATQKPMPFAPDRVFTSAQRFAERIWTIFHWATTDAFRQRFGGGHV